MKNFKKKKSDNGVRENKVVKKVEVKDKRLKKDQPKQEQSSEEKLDKQQPKKSIKRKMLVFFREFLKIVLVLVGCAFLGIFIAIGTRASSPYRFAEEYFSYYVTNNYEEMYKMIDCKESEFTNLENFKNKCEGEKVYGSITGYSLSKPVKEGNKITYVVTYYIGSNGAPNTYTITLHKQKKHTYLFFNTWKVSVNRFLISDYQINVPVGTSVTMDEIDISKYKKETSEDGTTDTYVVNKMFSGDHTIAVKLDATGEITKTQYVTEDNDSIEITTNDFAMKPDVQQKLYDYSTFIIKSIYEYAMDRTKNFEDISILYAATDEANASAKATFENITAAITQPDGASLRILDIKTLSPKIASFTYPDRVSVEVTYNYDFAAIGGMSTLSGIVDEYNGSGTATAMVYLNLIDDAWKIVKVDMECIDYSKQD